MVDYPGATWLPNNNFFVNRDGQNPRWIILHGTAGGSSAEAIAAYFQSTQGGNNPVSSHYIIGQDGHIVQAVSEEDGAWANGVLSSGHDSWWTEAINPNLITVSIEHCKPALDNSDTLTPQQQAASFTLVKHICERRGIPQRAADAQGGITGHFSIDPVNRSNCPGPYPWDQLWAFLKGGQTMLDLTDPVVSQFFTDGGNGTWKCKRNGVILLGANLTFYRSYGGPALLGLPLSNEIHLPQYPNTAIVPCERVMIIYDPERKVDSPPIQGPCYLLHIDSGLGQQLLLQSSSEQIQTLTNKLNQIHNISTLP